MTPSTHILCITPFYIPRCCIRILSVITQNLPSINICPIYLAALVAGLGINVGFMFASLRSREHARSLELSVRFCEISISSTSSNIARTSRSSTGNTDLRRRALPWPVGDAPCGPTESASGCVAGLWASCLTERVLLSHYLLSRLFGIPRHVRIYLDRIAT